MEIKVADYGLCALLPSLGASSPEKLESRQYMAPELIESSEEVFNEKVDIWSLGCLVYYLLCGKQAFIYESDSLDELDR